MVMSDHDELMTDNLPAQTLTTSPKELNPEQAKQPSLHDANPPTPTEIPSLIPPDSSINGISESTPQKLARRLSVVGLEPESPSKRRRLSSNPHASNNSNSTTTSTQQQPEEEHEPRLVIDRLLLHNFKSYAGTQEIGPFNASFSAVVGPNGSGKSNVIDSLLFVFGFRASKMRQSKLSELIHNSENHMSLPYCQVDIYFKTVVDGYNSDGNPIATPIPDSELKVSRKALRNNSSKYYINDHDSSYSEVITLLKGRGIDLDHKRFLILQGEVESIAQMKPKAETKNEDGLLEYLEDIIGTSDYKEKIEQCLVQIDELNDVCVKKEDLFKITERAKDELEPKKDEAIDFLKKEKDHLIKKTFFYRYSMQDEERFTAEKKAERKELKEQLHGDNSNRDKINKKTKKLNLNYEEMVQKIKQIDEETNDLKKAHKKIEKAKVTMDEKIKHMENKKKKATKSLDQNSYSLRESQTSIERFEQNLKDYEQQFADLNSQLEKEKSALEKIKLELADKTRSISAEIEELQKKLQPWQNEINKKDDGISLTESEKDIVQQKLSELEAQTSKARLRIEEISELTKSKAKQREHLKKEQVHVQGQIELGEGEVNDARDKLRSMENELHILRQKADEAKSRVTSVNTRNRVLQALVHLRDSGRLDGFHGRLGDLGVIDDKYDVAVSTGGGSLDDFVVDTVNCAQTCISYMRKNNLGFGKFIVLEKLRRPKERMQTPNNVPRLFDLIRPSHPKFAPAFYSSMYDTLVADNLQEANRVAFGGSKRWRVVTLDGKLVDVSGTMSGGGNRTYRGAMRLSSSGPVSNEISEADLRKLLKEVQAKEDAFDYANSVFTDMEGELNGFKDRLPQIEIELSKLSVESKSLEEEATEMRNKLANAKADTKAQENMKIEINKFDYKLNKLQQEKKKLHDGSKELEDKIETLQQKIMDIGGVKLKMQKHKVDSVLQKLEIINEKTDSDSLQVSKLKNKIIRLQKHIADNEKDISESESEIEQCRIEYEEQVTAFTDSEKKIHDLNFTKQELSEKSDEVKEQLDEMQGELNELRKLELELQNKLEKCEADIKGSASRIKNINSIQEGQEYRDVDDLLSWLDEDDELRVSLRQVNIEVPELTNEELSSLDMKEVYEEMTRNEQFLDEAKVDLDILIEYARRFKEYDDRKNDLNKSVNSRDNVKNTCEELKKQRLDEFMTGFNMISSTLKEMYKMITIGGNAELELVDSLDPFLEGVNFSVMPPKKSWKNISNLSGGEKTLSSLALVFALHRYKPTPLYVMDEIDAALDFRNVSIVANYIKERTKNAQFIVISLRNNMFELAQQLVGIYKVNNMTKSIALQNKEMIS